MHTLALCLHFSYKTNIIIHTQPLCSVFMRVGSGAKPITFSFCSKKSSRGTTLLLYTVILTLVITHLHKLPRNYPPFPSICSSSVFLSYNITSNDRQNRSKTAYRLGREVNTGHLLSCWSLTLRHLTSLRTSHPVRLVVFLVCPSIDMLHCHYAPGIGQIHSISVLVLLGFPSVVYNRSPHILFLIESQDL